ncbi:hypothetical protein [Kutzneria sp. NPDC052558]|uniref:hypothetical protein n=1 Tax=Kutzneria sp. NPDC052558 TaxID=3364121 RepID=UPI0037CC0D23
MPRWLKVLAHVVEPSHNAAGAVHGTAICAALIATVQSLATAAVAVPATLLVYWIAFSYAHFLGEGIAGGSASWLRGLRHSLAEEFSIVENALLPLVMLLLLAAAGVPIDTAVWISLGTAVALMFGWGLLAAGRSGHSGRASVGIGLTSALVGALVIVLKVAVKALG